MIINSFTANEVNLRAYICSCIFNQCPCKYFDIMFNLSKWGYKSLSIVRQCVISDVWTARKHRSAPLCVMCLASVAKDIKLCMHYVTFKRFVKVLLNSHIDRPEAGDLAFRNFVPREVPVIKKLMNLCRKSGRKLHCDYIDKIIFLNCKIPLSILLAII